MPRRHKKPRRSPVSLEGDRCGLPPPCPCGIGANFDLSGPFHCFLLFLFFLLAGLPSTLLLAYDTYFSIHSKTIHIKVIDDEAYEKNKNYFIELMGPRMVEMSFQKGVVPCPHTNMNVLLSSSVSSFLQSVSFSSSSSYVSVHFLLFPFSFSLFTSPSPLFAPSCVLTSASLSHGIHKRDAQEPMVIL